MYGIFTIVHAILCYLSTQKASRSVWLHLCPLVTLPLLLAPGCWRAARASSLRSPRADQRRAWTLAQHWREDGLVLGYNTAFLYDPA